MVWYPTASFAVERTCGFVSTGQKLKHYEQHGQDFGANSPEEYARMAAEFLTGTSPNHVLECIRSQGDAVRFDPTTDAYGVLDANGVIRTFFKPVPCISVRSALERDALRRTGRCHRHPDNTTYFWKECERW